MSTTTTYDDDEICSRVTCAYVTSVDLQHSENIQPLDPVTYFFPRDTVPAAFYVVFSSSVLCIFIFIFLNFFFSFILMWKTV